MSSTDQFSDSDCMSDTAFSPRHPVTAVRSLWEDPERFAQISTVVSGMLAYSFSILSGPILSRGLEASGRGDLAAVVAPTQLIGYALLLGLPLAAMYHAHDNEHGELISNSWTVALVVGVPVGVLFWSIAPWYMKGHPSESVAWFRAFLVMSIVFVPMSVSLELLRTRERMVAFNLLRNLPLILNTAFLVGLWIAGRVTLTTAFVSQFLALAVSYLWVFVVGGVTWRPHRTRLGLMWRQVRYGLQVWLGSVSSLIVNRVDQFLLVGMVSPAALGHYVVAVTGSAVSGPVGVAFGLTLFPKVRDAPDARSRRAATSRSFWLTIVASGGVAVVMAAIAPFALPFVFGQDFTASVPLLWILLPGQVMADLATVLVQSFLADGRPAVGSQGLGVAAVVTVVTLLVLVGPLGATGAAVSTTIAEATMLGYLGWRYLRDPSWGETPDGSKSNLR